MFSVANHLITKEIYKAVRRWRQRPGALYLGGSWWYENHQPPWVRELSEAQQAVLAALATGGTANSMPLVIFFMGNQLIANEMQ